MNRKTIEKLRLAPWISHLLTIIKGRKYYYKNDFTDALIEHDINQTYIDVAFRENKYTTPPRPTKKLN